MATNPTLRQRLLKASMNTNEMGRAALADSAPAPLLRAIGGNGNVNFTTQDITPGAVAGFSGKAAPMAYAGVNEGNPNTVQVMDQAAFQKPGQTGQLAVHEATHIMQNNLPPKVAAKIPADDPNDPYNFGGEQGLIASRNAGQTLLDKPREQQAAIMQYYTAQNDGYQQKVANGAATKADHAAAQQRQQVYGPWINDLNHVPQSLIMPTDPNAKGNTINTQVRPLPGPATDIPGMTNYAKQVYKPGQPAPGTPSSADDGWTEVSSTSDPGTKAVSDPWAEVSSAPDPAKPQAHWGSNISDIGSVLSQRLKSAVAGPYHALTDAPSSPDEMGMSNAAGPLGLATYRMFGKPSIDAASQVNKSNSFDTNANHVMDAIPIAGPWARQISDDTQEHGAVAGLTGLATDIIAPAAIGKGAGVVMRGTGKVAELATTTPASRTLFQTRVLVPGTSEQLLTRALKPPVTMPDFEQSANAALPEIAKRSPLSGTGGVKGFANAAEDAAEDEQSWYKAKVSPYRKTPGYGTAPRPSSISGAPIARAQMQSIPITNLIEDPMRPGAPFRMAANDPEGSMTIGGQREPTGIEARTASKANNWNRNFDVPTLDDARQDLNAKLNSFWNQSGGDRAAARSSPEVARTEAASNATRDVLYPKLASDYNIPEQTIRDRQNLFGQLTDVSDVANRRATVYGRQNPLSLQESLAVQPGRPIAGAIDFAGQRILKNATGSDALVNSAVDRYMNPAGTPLPPAEGFLPRVGNLLGKRLAAVGRVAPSAAKASYLSPGFSDPDDDAVRKAAILNSLFAPQN